MTKSEDQARIWMKKKYPGAMILKIPDYKQTGSDVAAGWPDYLLVHNYCTFFIEVKTHKSKSFTPAQLAMFPKLISAGATIYIWEKQRRGHTLRVFTTE